MMLFLSNCSSVEIIDTENSDYNIYGRKNVEDENSSLFFGKGKNDAIYVALNYLYSNEAVSENCGTDFEITEEDLSFNKQEGETFLFSGIYKGHAEYEFKISDFSYRINLEKTYFGKWNVTDCLLKNDEDYRAPWNYANSVWLCSEPNITYYVNGSADDSNFNDYAVIEVNGEKIQSRFVFQDMSIYVEKYQENESLEPELLFQGICEYSETQFTVKIEKKSDALFHGEYDILVFNRIR